MSTFDEVSLDSSNSFLKALQELQNVRPQLYSAAEYCEKSYLRSEQKHEVLENLKDYAVRSLVNTIDHLGTVAYKLNDLLDKKTFDVSTIEVKISCLNEQICTCQRYVDKEGLRQQQKLANLPRYHKHYSLPASVNRIALSGPEMHIDVKRKQKQGQARPNPLEIPPPKTLSWHLASGSTSPLKRIPQEFAGIENRKAPRITPQVFYMLDGEEVSSKLEPSHLQSFNRSPTCSSVLQTFGVTQKEWQEPFKQLSPFRSFNTSNNRALTRPLGRSKSMLAGFFFKRKWPK